MQQTESPHDWTSLPIRVFLVLPYSRDILTIPILVGALTRSSDGTAVLGYGGK